MRQQGQQNRRGRARGGRKIQSPLSRNYDSNGPDVKIRGTASHIAEKYTALARDALSSGDTIAAENLLQHAEHYNRIIMAAQSSAASDSQPVVSDQLNGAAAGGQEANAGSQGEELFDLKPSQDENEKRSDRGGRSKNGKNAHAANGRRRRRRPNGSGGPAKNGAGDHEHENKSLDAGAGKNSSKEAKSEKKTEAKGTPANGALL